MGKKSMGFNVVDYFSKCTKHWRFDVILSCITAFFCSSMLLWHNLWFYFHILNSHKQTAACTLTFIHSLIHWFNYFGNHSVVVFINAFIGLCCALGNDFLLSVAYSCSEVWNWLFFRVNKSDIRVKWAFCFYLLHSFLFSPSLSLSLHKWDKIPVTTATPLWTTVSHVKFRHWWWCEWKKSIS